MKQNVEQEDKEQRWENSWRINPGAPIPPKMRGLKGEKRPDGGEMETKVELEKNSSELKNQILVKVIEKYLYIHLVTF